MSRADPGTAARWRYALKPASWPKLPVPALLSQLLGVLAASAVSWPALGLGIAFTLLIRLPWW